MGISEDLESGGISVEEGYLDLGQVRALRECLLERRRRGEFSEGRIGHDETLQNNPEVRGDETCWLGEPLSATERQLLLGLERLRMQLNRDLYLGLFELELHYAWYPRGAGYTRHLDNARGRNARRVSLVLYLNEHWDCAAGGELEIYETQGAGRLLAPLAGRLVCFLSAEREHAVLPARRDRFSISGWYRAR